MISADQGRLVFEPLGEAGWRLCDTDVDAADAARLVAYVERQSGGGYEAIWMWTGILPSIHASREDVLRTAEMLRRRSDVDTGGIVKARSADSGGQGGKSHVR